MMASLLVWLTWMHMYTFFVISVVSQNNTREALAVEAIVNDNVTLPCMTSLDSDVVWKFQRKSSSVSTYVYTNGKINQSVGSRFTMNRTTSGQFDLVITDVSANDSGLYVCTEDNGLGQKHPVQLYVDFAATTTSAYIEDEQQSQALYGLLALILLPLIVIIVLVICIVRKRCKQTKYETEPAGTTEPLVVKIDEGFNGSNSGKAVHTIPTSTSPKASECSPTSTSLPMTDGHEIPPEDGRKRDPFLDTACNLSFPGKIDKLNKHISGSSGHEIPPEDEKKRDPFVDTACLADFIEKADKLKKHLSGQNGDLPNELQPNVDNEHEVRENTSEKLNDESQCSTDRNVDGTNLTAGDEKNANR